MTAFDCHFWKVLWKVLNLTYSNLLHVQAFPVPPSGLSALLIIWFCFVFIVRYQEWKSKQTPMLELHGKMEKSIWRPVKSVVWTNNKVEEIWFMQLLGHSKHCRQHSGEAFSSFIQIFAVVSCRKWKCWCCLSANARLGRTRESGADAPNVDRAKCEHHCSTSQTSQWLDLEVEIEAFFICCVADGRLWSTAVQPSLYWTSSVVISEEQHQFCASHSTKWVPSMWTLTVLIKIRRGCYCIFRMPPTRLLLHLLPWTVWTALIRFTPAVVGNNKPRTVLTDSMDSLH